MIYRCMRRIPTGGMTRLAVARRSEVFSDRITYKCTGARVMAVGAVGKMRVCRDKSICMTGRTVRRARCRYKAAVVNNMDRIPARAVTVRTVAASTEVLAISAIRRYSGPVNIMTGGTRVMRIGCCAYQSVVMTAVT